MERIQNRTPLFCHSLTGRVYLPPLLLNGHLQDYRTTGETRQYDFHLFWSYKTIQEGREDLLAENIMNVVVFIPVGLLLGIAFKQVTWWKVLLVGCSISAVIELLQFFFMRGFSELDDVMHNTLGCLIGFGFMIILRIIFKTRYNNV